MSTASEKALSKVGWQLGREVDTSLWQRAFEGAGVHMHRAAKEFLEEFGGLAMPERGPGVTRARSSFNLDPMLCQGEEDRFADWGEEVGELIFPVGELDEGRFFLGVGESGELYLVADWLATFGPVPAALDGLVLGIRARTVVE